MNYLSMALQNTVLIGAVLIGAVFATYWFTDSWWGLLFLLGWLVPADTKK